MDKMRLPNSIFLLLVLFGAAQFAYYAPRLPEIVGSHFGASGSVNGWQTKLAFFAMELLMIVLATIIGFAVPRIIASMPISLINLPNKEFWLAPERREETLLYFRAWSAWFGCALLAFLLFVMELAFRANLQSPPRLNSAAFVPALIMFILFSVFSTIRLVRRFAKTP